MSRSFFCIAVTKTVTVDFDETKLDAHFWDDFNSNIQDRGGPDIEYLAKHAAWNFVQGSEDFIEGIGPLDEMNIIIREIDSDVQLESQP